MNTYEKRGRGTPRVGFSEISESAAGCDRRRQKEADVFGNKGVMRIVVAGGTRNDFPRYLRAASSVGLLSC